MKLVLENITRKLEIEPTSQDIYLVPQIGDYIGGGVVFYTGETTLIVSPVNVINTSFWGCLGTDIVGTSLDIGTGKHNTDLILAGCGERPIAASYAVNYNGGGYSDWYLPSYFELQQIMLNMNLIGGTWEWMYWSSSTPNSTQASVWNTDIPPLGGVVNKHDVDYQLGVRAVRTLTL